MVMFVFTSKVQAQANDFNYGLYYDNGWYEPTGVHKEGKGVGIIMSTGTIETTIGMIKHGSLYNFMLFPGFHQNAGPIYLNLKGGILVRTAKTAMDVSSSPDSLVFLIDRKSQMTFGVETSFGKDFITEGGSWVIGLNIGATFAPSFKSGWETYPTATPFVRISFRRLTF